MPYTNLEQIFTDFSGLSALIIGDVMVDTYTWGKVERISPEAPVPVLHINRREERLGGAANVALNMKALGAKPFLCSVIGDDSEGKMLLSLLNQSDLPNEGIVTDAKRVTTTKQRILSGSHHLLRVDSEDTSNLLPEAQKALLAKIEQLLPLCQVIVFEDYDKGVINQSLIETVIGWAEAKGIPTVVDPKKRNFLHYKKATLFKPNLKELREGLKIEFNPDNESELIDAVEKLKTSLNLEGALITLSERGMFIDFGGKQIHVPAWLRHIADVSGAGDTVISVAALCLALNLPPEIVLGLSNLAGGMVCEYVGVVPIQKQALYEEAIKQNLIDWNKLGG